MVSARMLNTHLFDFALRFEKDKSPDQSLKIQT